MHHANGWVERALKYRPTLQDYCDLAMRPTLDEGAASRMAAILHQAEADCLLGWLLDEADHLIAHLQNLIHDDQIQQQQLQLQTTIDGLWMEELIQDLSPQPKPQFTAVTFRQS
jgi:hypothetical protein